tara:strand:- start:330 stop:692 length:363 start_codon:yes stop_codon:yes gene_type:complete
MKNERIAPKFEIGTEVLHAPDLYGMTRGTIYNIDRIFQEIDPRTGQFDLRGLATFESTIKFTAIPYEFDGETLTVHFPESGFGGWTEKAKTQVSKFYGYAYSVRSAKMNTVWSERQLKAV